MRKDIKKLRQRLSALKAQGRDKLAQIQKLEAEIGEAEASEEQAAKLKALEAECASLETQIAEASDELETEERRLARERAFAPLQASTALTPARFITSSEPDPAQTHGFRNMAEFGLAVFHACRPGGQLDERLITRPGGAGGPQAAPTNYHQEGGGSSGEGYYVPPAMRQEVYDLMLDDPMELSNMVDAEPTSANQVGYQRDETTPWGATGIQAYWRAEGSQMTPSKLAEKAANLTLHELYAFVLATEELMQDAPRLNARLTRGSARAINWKSSEAIMWGNGVGQPYGWMSSGALVTVAKESSQSAAGIIAENVAKMFSRILPSALSRSVWLVNSDCFPQLMTMTLGDQPIWTPPSSGFTGAPGGFLFGRPIVPSEHCQTMGTLGDIQFVDPMGYYSPRKAGINFAQSMHLYFDYNMQAFRWTFRLGGQPYLSAPVSPAKGSNTKSHFVALATRP